jgi:hypothetical protein
MFHVEHPSLPYNSGIRHTGVCAVFRNITAFLFVLVLFGSSVSAFAAPGELDAVVRRCGVPGAEDKRVSQTTNQIERTLIYRGVLYLHFEPVPGGWGFVSAWDNHLPMSRAELEHRLPCFRDAMQDAAKQTPAQTGVDPSIAAQTAQQPINDVTFGIPHFALIVLLAITLLVLLLLPSARQRKLAREARKPVEHVYRKPNLDEYIPPPVQPTRHDLE